MHAIEILTSEHRLIEATLDALLVWSEQAGRRNSTCCAAELRPFLAFLREFVDECHHGKEEQVLFAAMKAHGVAGPCGPIEVMLHEHDQGRALMARLEGFAQKPQPWTGDDLTEVADLALTYAALMRQHIRKEDTILYPMAAARLPEAAQRELSQGFERFERLEKSRGTYAQLQRLAVSLVARYRPRAA
jgi:hemerythrin-like domain-containing protein